MKKLIAMLLIATLLVSTPMAAFGAIATPPVTEVKPAETVRPENVTLENIKELSKTEKALEFGLSALELEGQGKMDEANKFWLLWQQENKNAAAGASTIPAGQQQPAQQAEIQNIMTQINALSLQLTKAKDSGDKTAYNKLSAEIQRLQAKLNLLMSPNPGKGQPSVQPPVAKVPEAQINPKPVVIKEEAKINLKEIEKYAKSTSATLFKLFRQLADRYNNLVNKYNDLQKKLLERERQIKELEMKLQNVSPDDDNPDLDKLFDNTNKGK